jgi:ABC transporter
VYRYPGNYARYLEMKEARIAADDADADRAKTKLRRESLWMAKQPRLNPITFVRSYSHLDHSYTYYLCFQR